MAILENFKNHLELIGKDTTLLGAAIIVLFVENVYQRSYGESLINNEKFDSNQLLHFKFLFGLIIFLFACKLPFLLFNLIINQFTPLYKLGFFTSYKVGFGCFVLSMLLFYHAWNTDNSNAFLKALPENGYKAVTVLIALLCLFFAAICDWSGEEKKSE